MLWCVTVGHVCVVVWCVTVGHVCVVVCHSRPCVCCGVTVGHVLCCVMSQ